MRNVTACVPVTDQLGWTLASVCHKGFICFFGSLGNVASLVVVGRCQQVGAAMRAHLLVLFGLMLTVCTVTLPGVAFTNYSSSFCIDEVPSGVYLFFSTSNSVLLQMERFNFAAVAVIRLLAVWRPVQFRVVVESVRTVLVVQVAIIVYLFLPWVVGLLSAERLGYDSVNFKVDFGSEDVNKLVHTFFSVNYCIPFSIMLVAYVALMALMVRREGRWQHRTSSSSVVEHVSSMVRVLLLVHVILDGPHVLIHQLMIATVPSFLANTIVHMLFYLHLVVDPFLFVGMNPYYRRALFSISPCFPAAQSQRPSQPTSLPDVYCKFGSSNDQAEHSGADKLPDSNRETQDHVYCKIVVPHS